jgi:hypothetical protein
MTQKSVKVVVGMQHTPTTFAEMARTPKKAAYARHFCFTNRGGGFQIAIAKGILVAVGYRFSPGGAGIRLVFENGWGWS